MWLSTQEAIEKLKEIVNSVFITPFADDLEYKQCGFSDNMMVDMLPLATKARWGILCEKNS